MRCGTWARDRPRNPAEDWVLAPMRGRARGAKLRRMSEFTVRDRLRWLGVTLVVAAAAVPLSFLIWRTPPGVAGPPPSMLPILLPVEVVIPALSLGFGVAFMLFGRKLVIRDRASAMSRASFISIWWLLVNWWPHSNFHRVSTGWVSLAAIDYFFHATVIVATCVVAAFFLSVMRERQQVPLLDGGAFEVGRAQPVGGRS